MFLFYLHTLGIDFAYPDSRIKTKGGLLMGWIVFAVFLTLSAATLIFYQLVKRKHPLLQLLTIVFISLIIVVTILISSLFNDQIWVFGYNENSSFGYELINRRLSASGTCYVFKTLLSKEKLFSGLASEFAVFNEEDDYIQLISDHEIFTVRQKNKNSYVLYGEYLLIAGCLDSDLNEYNKAFPFPTDKVKNNSEFIPVIEEDMFYITCDIEYLRKFYGFYRDEGLKVNGNVMQYDGITLTVNQDLVSIQRDEIG